VSQPLKVLFAGAGAFGLPSLRALLGRHEVLRVYTQPDRPAGRGRKLTPTPIGEFVSSLAPPRPVLTPTPDLNAETLPEADVLVVIAFGQKISQALTTHPRLGAVNLHASRLPAWRGAAPIHHALLNGDTITGNSIIRLAEKMDAGAVLALSQLPIGELETTGELHDRLADDGAGLLLKVLDELASGTATETQQDHSRASLARKLSREQSTLDFARPAAQLALQLRAMYPWPGCRVEIIGETTARATLVRARPIAGTGSPGVINPAGLIGTGEGLLQVVELQPESGRPMSLRDYTNGRPWRDGMLVRPLA
jgi:methionyl-tRNA formyltransferase